MSTQEATSSVSKNEHKPMGFRTRAAIAAGSVLLAVGAAWAANDVANTLCNPPEASAIGGHPQPAGFCDEYQGFKDAVANRIEAAIDAAIPDFPIVNDPVFDPNTHPVG
jgi:hypothetical protein